MDIFIGKWRKSQEKALLKAMDETIKLTKQGIINYNFDDIVNKDNTVIGGHQRHSIHCYRVQELLFVNNGLLSLIN